MNLKHTTWEKLPTMSRSVYNKKKSNFICYTMKTEIQKIKTAVRQKKNITALTSLKEIFYTLMYIC